MATIAIVGAGHVGVVYAAGLAELGHRVRAIDVDRRRMAALRRGRVWFHEPGLPDLLQRGLRRRRITFTTSHVKAFAGADFIFVCVGTPTTSDGSLDDSALRSAFELIRRHTIPAAAASSAPTSWISSSREDTPSWSWTPS